MVQKILGYVELVWDCDSCGTTNPGAIKTCTSCGAPQPPNVKFRHVDPDNFNFIKDQALIRMAQSGPDKHCPYCGTRNLAEAEICSNCGGDLRVGATNRPVGVVEAEPKPAAPPQPVAGRKASPAAMIIFAIIAIVICVAAGLFFSKMNQTEAVNATVAGVNWQRSVQVLGYQTVRQSGWLKQIPAGADPYNCELRYSHRSAQPVANSKEVCGEPYTVDTGTGVGRVQQDCYFEVYEDYCSYDTMAWVPVQTLVESGTDLNPYWPNTNISSNYRLGDQTERYTILFDVNGTTYSVNTSDLELFRSAQPNSRWQLEINAFGDVRSADPVRGP